MLTDAARPDLVPIFSAIHCVPLVANFTFQHQIKVHICRTGGRKQQEYIVKIKAKTLNSDHTLHFQ